jgi:hypothetical protein
MVHCGYEATAITDTLHHPFKALVTGLRGVRTEGEMVPDIPLNRQRPAPFVFSRHVEKKLAEIRETGEKRPKRAKEATAA